MDPADGAKFCKICWRLIVDTVKRFCTGSRAEQLGRLPVPWNSGPTLFSHFLVSVGSWSGGKAELFVMSRSL